MVMLESTNSARLRKRLRLAAQQTKAANDFHDMFEIWTADRPIGTWDSGAVLESLTLKTSGDGKLYAEGSGGPISSESMIVLESAYRFRMRTSVLDSFKEDGKGIPDISGSVLVVNRSRMFVIDNAKPEDQDDYLMDIYLTELIGKPIPEVTP